MVQPKTPPISVRLDAGLLARVQTYADGRQITRHAALVELIDQAVTVALGNPTSAEIIGQAYGRLNRAAATTNLAERVMAAVKPAPIHVHAPQLGTFERKPYQKGKQR